jgi:competence protein ComFC
MQVLGRPSYRFVQWFWAAIDLLYPPMCGGCKSRGVRWCEDCQKKVLIITPPICGSCGQPQKNQGLCSQCIGDPPAYQALRSWGVFSGPLRRVLHQIKYYHDRGLGEVLSRHLILYLKQLNWEIDLIVPVPLGLTRLKERGYNQSDLLAHPLAMGSGIPYDKKALSRIRDTQSQVGLSATQRKSNVDGAFKADPLRVSNQSILIVDDVTTSGATIKACAVALLEADAKLVYGLTLARSTLGSHF